MKDGIVQNSILIWSLCVFLRRFDPWSLLSALRNKSISLGAKFVQGEGIGFDFKELPDTLISGDTSGEPYKKIDKLIVRGCKT